MTIAERTEIVAAIREWVDAEVIPAASGRHAFPETLVEQMKGAGLFGVGGVRWPQARLTTTY
jgi:hypothetical protein